MHGDRSQLVRRIALEEFVHPARQRGLREVSIPVMQLREKLIPAGFSRKNVPQICSALETSEFRRQSGYERMTVDGPESKRSTTVVFHLFFPAADSPLLEQRADSDVIESPEAKAFRLSERLRGLMKDEIKACGGTEAFMCWVRSDDEDGR